MKHSHIPSDQPVAWVTGSGAARVGRSVAKYFAQQGYRLVVHAKSSRTQALELVEELKDCGHDSMAVFGEIEDPDFAKIAVKQIVCHFGRLDVLVNSAAVWSWRELERTTAEDVRRQWEVNSLGTFLCSQAAGLQMVEQSSGGAIILIGDWAVHRPYADFAAYFASKGSIESLTRVLAVEFARRNSSIRVNAILPGPVLLDESISDADAARVHSQSLLKIPGTPDHISQAAHFLAKHDFITGVCLNVDGGRSIYSISEVDALAHPTFGK